MKQLMFAMMVSICVVANDSQAFRITPGQEFAVNSFVYKPLAPDAPLDPNSAALVIGLNDINQSAIKFVGTYAFANQIFIVGLSQPTVRVLNMPYWDVMGTGHNPFDPYPPLQDDWSAVPLPDNFGPTVGEDASAIVYQPSTHKYWEFFGLRKTGNQVRRSDGVLVDEWAAWWGGQIPDISVNPGYWVERAGVLGLGQNAASIVQMGGIMTVEEQKAGVIDHVIAIGLPVTTYDFQHNNFFFSWPARRSDGWSDDPIAVPMGTRFRLPADMDLDAMDMDPYARMVAKAVQKHGMVVVDTTAVATLVIAAEDPGLPLYGTADDPYFGPGGIFGCPPWDSYGGTVDPPEECRPDQKLRGFPWTGLQALAQCYFDHYDTFPRPVYWDNCDADLP